MKKLFIALLCLFSPLVFAKTLIVETSGEGLSKETAINNALIQALRQVNGTNIESAQASQTQTSKKSGNGTEYQRDRSELVVVETKGKVDSYDVLNEFCTDTGCEVKLKVRISVRKTKGLNDKRRALAVKTFTGGQSGKDIARELESLMVKDRKFSVLDNPNDARLDYIVEGKTIESRTTKRVVDNSRTVELTGEYIEDKKTYYSSRVVVEYKIIDIYNGQIKWSDRVTTTSSRNNLSLLKNITARKVFDALKENIYPLLVLKAEDGSLIVNSGGETVSSGDLYDVYKMGKTIIDPVTGERLGANEIKVGTVKISRVLPKMAYATLIKGDAASLGKMQIARKAKQQPAKRKTSSPVKKSAPVKQESTDTPSAGGILLP